MHEDGEALAVEVDRRRRPPGAAPRQLDRPPGLVHELPGLGEGIADHERGVAECAGELAAERCRVRRGAEIDDEPRDDRLGPAPAEEIDEQHHGDRGDHRVVRPQHRRAGDAVGETGHAAERQHPRERERRGERRSPRLARRAGRPEEDLQRGACDEAAEHERQPVVHGERLDRRVHVRDRDHDPREPGREPPRRVREMEVHERPAMEVEERPRDVAEEPGHPGDRHQRADAALVLAVPRDRPARQQDAAHCQIRRGKRGAELRVVERPLDRDAERDPQREERESPHWLSAGRPRALRRKARSWR